MDRSSTLRQLAADKRPRSFQGSFQGSFRGSSQGAHTRTIPHRDVNLQARGITGGSSPTSDWWGDVQVFDLLALTRGGVPAAKVSDQCQFVGTVANVGAHVGNVVEPAIHPRPAAFTGTPNAQLSCALWVTYGARDDRLQAARWKRSPNATIRPRAGGPARPSRR